MERTTSPSNASVPITLKKDDKIVGTSTSTVSKDGKTTTLSGKGSDASGKAVSSVQVYDKE
jgi:hypothetical protein